MTNDHPSAGLRKRYLAALQAGAPCFDVWRLFLSDSWFRSELRKHAAFIIRTSGQSQVLEEDVQQEVLWNLRFRLEQSVYFGLDPTAVIENFAHWTGKLVLNECRDALRRLHVGHESPWNPSTDEEESAAVVSSKRQELVREMQLAIEELPRPHSAVLRLYLAGHNLTSIAKQLKLTYWQVYLAFHSGIEQLRRDFS